MDYSTIKVMKTLRIVYLFVIVAIVAACSSTEDATTDKPSAPTGSKTYTMTINANKHGDTRALTLDGKTLNSSWKKGEQVKVIRLSALSPYALGILGTLTAQSDGVSTTLTGAVTEPVEGYPIQLVFPRFPYDYTGQKGTLDDIAANFDYATCEVAADQWELTNGNITTKSSVLFSNESQAIVKFNLQNSDGTPISASSLTIHDANDCILQQTDGMIGGAAGDLIINLDEPSNEVWVAISSYYIDKTSDLTLTATVGSYSYTYTKSDVTFEHGKYYSITVKMNLVETDELSTPLTLEAIEDGNISFQTYGEISYKINDGEIQNPSIGNVSFSVNSGDVVSFYGDNAYSLYYYNSLHVQTISCTADCYIYGNVMSLISSTNFETLITIGNNVLYNVFKNNTHIKNHPNKKILLPATTLTTNCYNSMFYGCTGLTTAPDLPATTLASDCYRYMFSGCTGLTSAPDLPATTMTTNCYCGMFYRCTSLISAPDLPATTLATNCYNSMFSGCTSLTSVPELPATTLTEGCYNQMFAQCNLTSTPELPATTLAPSCYSYMFYGCNNLVSIEGLPATTLADKCYLEMFSNCTSLTTPPELPATTMKASCYTQMFSGCTSLTSSPDLPATTLADSCYLKMFYGCKEITSSPDLPVSTLASSCYEGMFYGCKALASTPSLPATILAANCYKQMFSGCTSITSAPTLPATTLAEGCYYGMFNGCSGLTSTPSLLVMTLAPSCYREMFNYCTGLTSAPTLPATTLAPGCYREMFSNCRSLTSSPDLPATTLVDECYYKMFYYCSKLKSIKCLATDISASKCTTNWLLYAASNGTFYRPSSMDGKWQSGTSGIPSGWTTVDATE